MFSKMQKIFFATLISTLLLATTSPYQLTVTASSDPTNKIVPKIEDDISPSLTMLAFPNDKRIFKHGNDLEIHAKIEDDSSGILEATAEFRRKGSTDRIIVKYPTGSEAVGNVYKLQYSVPKYQRNGIYILEEITIFDKALNVQRYSSDTMDFSNMSFEIANDVQDTTPPTSSGISFSNDKRIFKSGETIELLAAAEDEMSGIVQIAAEFKDKESNEQFYAFFPYDSEPIVNNVYKLKFRVPLYQKNGIYSLKKIIISDGGGNRSTYTSDLLDFSEMTIEIASDEQDTTPPSLLNLSFPNEKRIFKQGDKFQLHASAIDDSSGIREIRVEFKNKESNEKIFADYELGDNLGANMYKLKAIVMPYQSYGVYTFEQVTVHDGAGNKRTYIADKTNTSNMDIQIVKDTQDVTPPTLSKLEFPNEKRSFKSGDKLELLATVEDDISGVSEIIVQFNHKDSGKSIYANYGGEPKPTGNVVTLKSVISEYQTNGIYTLARISIYDKAGNDMIYTPDMMDFRNFSFEVKDTDVITPPGNGGGTEVPPPTVGGGGTTLPPAGGGNEQTPPPNVTQKPFVIKGVENNGYYSKDFAIEFENGTIQLGGKNYLSGTPITEEGLHILSITASSGEKSEIKFVLDKTPPEVLLESSNKKVTNKDIYIQLKSNDKTTGIKSITLPDGSTKTEGSFSFKVNQNGNYTFQVTDLANNKTIKSIKISNIDKKAPSTPTIQTITSKNITGKGEKKTTIYLLKGKTVLAKATVSKYGNYKISFKKQNKNTALSLYLKDVAGNKSKSKQLKIK